MVARLARLFCPLVVFLVLAGCSREEAEMAEPGGMGAGQPEAPGPDVTPPQEVLYEGTPPPGIPVDTTAGER